MKLAIKALLAASVLAGTASAGPPSIRELRPWGAQRGQTVTLTIAGDQLAPGAELFAAVPGKLEEQPGGNAGQLTFKLELSPVAPVGLYPIRLRTAAGLSNALLFSVGDLPEVAETEPNDTMPDANSASGASSSAAASLPLIALPTTINGTAAGTDQDVFRVAGKKGDRLVAEVEAQRISSLLDPLITLFSANGRELASADDTPGLGVDCRLDVTLPEDGEYYVAIHDTKFNGGSPGQYRLKIGPLSYAANIFPLGWQRGREVELTLSGGSLPGAVKTKIVAESRDGLPRTFVTVDTQGPLARLPFRFVLGDEPELLEPAADGDRWFKDAAVMNGQIGQPGEVDRYKFPVKGGEVWVFEVDAASLGSQLDGLLTVSGPQGNVLASADDGNGLDPRVQLQVPGAIDHVVLALEDLHRRGGPGFAYRLRARPVRTDFALQVVPSVVNIPRSGTAVVQVNAVRSGYNGPIQLTVPDELAGVQAEGGLIAEGANDGLLLLSVTPDAALRAIDLTITGQAGPAAKPMLRAARPGGQNLYAMAEPIGAHVPAAVTEAPPVVFTVAEGSVRVLHGPSRTVKITAARGPAAAEAITINGTGLPGGTVSGTMGTIAKEANEITLNLVSSPEVPVVGPFTMQLQAQTPVVGRQETIQLPPVRVEIARPFAIELLAQNVTIAAGSKARVAVIVRREAPFDGVVKLGAVGSIPEHVSLGPADVPKGESLALLELAVGDAAAPAEFDLQIRASTDMEGRKRDKDYAIPDTPLKVKVLPKTAQ